MDGRRLVFLDESGVTTNMVRRYGWGPKSERLVTAVPQGHWRSLTFVAGLRADGLVAPLVVDGAMSGAMFRADVAQILAPGLEPGDVVGMDNLSVHKVAGVREAIRAAGGSVLSLPSYSPDLNPMEQVLAKVKGLLRKAGARSRAALEQAIREALEAFSPEECRNYLIHCGYEPV